MASVSSTTAQPSVTVVGNSAGVYEVIELGFAKPDIIVYCNVSMKAGAVMNGYPVRKSILETHSQVFADMFEHLPQSKSDKEDRIKWPHPYEDYPSISLVGDEPANLKAMLSLLVPTGQADLDLKTETLVALYRLSDKYSMPRIQDWMRDKLRLLVLDAKIEELLMIFTASGETEDKILAFATIDRLVLRKDWNLLLYKISLQYSVSHRQEQHMIADRQRISAWAAALLLCEARVKKFEIPMRIPS